MIDAFCIFTIFSFRLLFMQLYYTFLSYLYTIRYGLIWAKYVGCAAEVRTRYGLVVWRLLSYIGVTYG
jgi:hypothetical protein